MGPRDQYHSAFDISMELYGRVTRIKQADGFLTDIGNRVFRGRVSIDEQMIPCAVILELDDQQEDTDGKRSSMVKLRQSYAIAGYAKCNPDYPNDMAHNIIMDIKRVIFGDGRDLDYKVMQVNYRGREIGPRADGDSSVFGVIRLDIEYSENLGKPDGASN